MRLLLVINTNLPGILQRLRDIAFDKSKIAIFCYTLGLTLLSEGFPWDDLHFLCMSMDGQGTKCRRKIA